MMNSVLIGNGYWANVVKEKIVGLTNLLFVMDSQSDIEVLGDYNIDIAFVCSSTSSHYSIIKLCIESDIKHIFCTKPFTGDYKLAKELFDMADDNGVNIFVDNLFLFRREILDIRIGRAKTFCFIWNKSDNNYKENICDSLLYHDLYLLMKLSGSKKWDVVRSGIGNRWLGLDLQNDHQSCFFEYNRDSQVKNKWIIIDDDIIDLSIPLNDPLKECIANMVNGGIDYDLSREITLDTLMLMDAIKDRML